MMSTKTAVRAAVVLLSGGIDSSTTAAIARHEGYEIYALSFDYNQRHKIELEAAKKVALSLKVKKHLIIKFDLREIGGSALTSALEVPKGNDQLQVTSNELKNHKSRISDSEKNSSLVSRYSSLIPITYVPARNTIFLSFALAWAEALNAGNIFIGANAVDYSGYPDCRPEYLESFEKTANLATKASVEGKIRFAIKAPLLYLTKAEIIRKGSGLGLDYSLTWSCYDPQPLKVKSSKLKVQSYRKAEAKQFTDSPIHRFTATPCGKCDSCLFRARGFQEAGIKHI